MRQQRVARFYGSLMTGDALTVLANGAVMDRESVIESLEQAPHWRTYHIGEVRLIRGGSDSASFVCVATAHREGDEPAFTGVMSSQYRHRDDALRLALYQQTPNPSPDRSFRRGSAGVPRRVTSTGGTTWGSDPRGSLSRHARSTPRAAQ